MLDSYHKFMNVYVHKRDWSYGIKSFSRRLLLLLLIQQEGLLVVSIVQRRRRLLRGCTSSAVVNKSTLSPSCFTLVHLIKAKCSLWLPARISLCGVVLRWGNSICSYRSDCSHIIWFVVTLIVEQYHMIQW